MLVYEQGVNVVIKRTGVKTVAIPRIKSRFEFAGDRVILTDITTDRQYSEYINDVRDESGTLVGSQAQVETYLSTFVGA